MHPRSAARLVAFAALLSMLFSACSGGGGGGGTIPGGGGGTPTPTPTPTSTPTSSPSAAYNCPTSDTQTSVARGGSLSAQGAGSSEATRWFVAHPPQQTVTGSSVAIGVTYDRAAEMLSHSAIVSHEQSLGATFASETSFPHLGLVGHTLIVPTARLLSIEGALRAQPGVKAVGVLQRRYALTVSQGYFPNDPYFDGFSGDLGAPYYESQTVPGQWDMHVIRLEDAFAYSQSNNGSGITNAGALGSSSVKIALIDTGQDTTHPELHTKVVYQKCFITNAAGTAQSTSDFTTDPQGHGTDTAGIAAEDTGNDFGFTGAGGNVVIYGYRVFPEPDNSCAGNNPDSQCSADTTDIASSVDDAIAQGVNVISISLGGGDCSNGVDTDPYEGPAIQSAISHGIVVVAASGNSSSTIDAPACANNVIAAGASALADGTTNGSGHAGGTAANPIEYVASYSNYGSTNTLHSSASWGIAAPGADPNGDTDTDDLHWVENIWTSLPYNSNFAGECTDDYPNSTGTTPPVDCRELIAGTSMSTPHIAGVAALIISATGSTYTSAGAMKTLLCSTADDLGDPHQGCGRLNAYRAMAKALGDPNLP